MGKKKRLKESKKKQIKTIPAKQNVLQGTHSQMWTAIILFGAIAICVLIVYSNTYNSPFILDDKENLEMIPSKTLGDLFNVLTGQALFYDQLYSGFP